MERVLRLRPTADRTPQSSPRRVHTLLRAALRDGVYRPGTMLAEHTLIREFEASRNAVREALRLLVADGLVTRARARGTVVVTGMIDIKLGFLMPEGTRPPLRPYVGQESIRTERTDTRLVSAAPVLQRLLDTTAPEVRLVEQVTFVGDVPMMVRTGYHPLDEHPDPADDELDLWWATSDRSGVFERRFGTRYGHFQERFQALTCDSRTAEQLQLPVGSPVLLYESVVIDADGRPREAAFHHFRGDLTSASVNHRLHA